MAYQKLPGIYRKEDQSPSKQKKSIGDGVPVEEKKKKKELNIAEYNKDIRRRNKQIDIERHSEKALGKKPEYYFPKGFEIPDVKKWDTKEIPDLVKPQMRRAVSNVYKKKKKK